GPAWPGRRPPGSRFDASGWHLVRAASVAGELVSHLRRVHRVTSPGIPGRAPQEAAMTEFERYVIEEHVEDFNDGLISRRELLRRVGLITGGVATAAALLATMGCGTQPTGTPVTPTSRATSAQPDFATPPAHPTPDGITVRENDPRIKVTPLAVTGTDGATLISYHAVPAGRTPAGGILVVHENRGLVVHIKDVVRRVATAGFSALAVDLLSRDGGADKLSDPAAYAAVLAKRPVAAMVSDLRQARGVLSGAGAGTH